MKKFLFALALVVLVISSGCSMGVAPYRGISYGGATYGTGYVSSGGGYGGYSSASIRRYRLSANMAAGVSATVTVTASVGMDTVILGGGPITLGNEMGFAPIVDVPLPPGVTADTYITISGTCSDGHTVFAAGPMSSSGGYVGCSS